MHVVVMDCLEEYLSGTLAPAAKRAVEAHLTGCRSCREEVRGMEELSPLFGSLRSEEAVAPSPAFLVGVRERAAQDRRATASFASLFALDFAFARRMVFASLLTLAVLGGYLISHEADSAGAGISPEALLAQQDSPGFVSGPAQDNMLVTLTAYDRR